MGRPMPIGMIFLILLSLLPAVQAQENVPARPLNEFRHEGGTLVCFSDAATAKGYLPCLRIGRLAIGMTLGEMEEEIKEAGGQFEEAHPGKGDAETRLYSLKAGKNKNEKNQLVVAYSGGKAEALELSGREAPALPSFSSVRLGDAPIRVVGLIGPAFSTKLDPVTGETFWEYGLFPFRIGFKGGKVHSIFVWKGK